MKNFIKIIIYLTISSFYINFVNAEIVYIDIDKIMMTSSSGTSLNKYIEDEQKKILEKFKKKEADFKDKEKKYLRKKIF